VSCKHEPEFRNETLPTPNTNTRKLRSLLLSPTVCCVLVCYLCPSRA